MKLHVIALYPTELEDLVGLPGVIRRRRRGVMWTQIECQILREGGLSIARPRQEVPSSAGPPVYKLNLEVNRKALHKSGIAVPFAPAGRPADLEPEARMLAPLWNGPERLLFEFPRAEILFVSPVGEVEVRFVAVDSRSGEVGTETQFHFHTKFGALVHRCVQQIAGGDEIFPFSTSTFRHYRPAIPRSGANLEFGRTAERSSPARDKDPEGSGAGQQGEDDVWKLQG